MIQTFSLAVLKIWYILSYRASLMWLNFMLDQTPAFYIVVFTLSVHRQSWGRGGGLGGDMVSEGGIPNKTWQGVNKKLIRCQVTWQSGENWPQGLLMKNWGCQKEEDFILKDYHLKPLESEFVSKSSYLVLESWNIAKSINYFYEFF